MLHVHLLRMKAVAAVIPAEVAIQTIFCLYLDLSSVRMGLLMVVFGPITLVLIKLWYGPRRLRAGGTGSGNSLTLRERSTEKHIS